MLPRFRLNSIGLLVLLGLSMSGCSKFAVNNSSLDYRDAKPLPPLQLPADQATRPFVALYPVPALPERAPDNAPVFTNEKGNRFVMPAPQPLDTAALQARASVDVGRPSAPTIVVDGNGFPILRAEGNPDQVWQSLLQSLSTAKINVTKNTRATSQIDVRLDEQPYTLRLGRSGSATTVSLQDRQDALADPTLTTSLLKQIIQHWPI
ncbi:MAG: hypothetical protein WA154_10555 [Moraxellaceae bacterium]